LNPNETVFVITIQLELNDLLVIFGLVIGAAAYFTRQGLIVWQLQKETKKQRETLKVLIMNIAETMDKDRAFEFYEKVFMEKGRWD
jgi:hypothetical protein